MDSKHEEGCYLFAGHSCLLDGVFSFTFTHHIPNGFSRGPTPSLSRFLCGSSPPQPRNFDTPIQSSFVPHGISVLYTKCTSLTGGVLHPCAYLNLTTLYSSLVSGFSGGILSQEDRVGGTISWKGKVSGQGQHARFSIFAARYVQGC